LEQGELSGNAQAAVPAESAWRQPTRPAPAETQVSDAGLLDRVRAGDERALMVLYDRYAGFVLTVALRILGDRELAQEVLQDTFWRCWNGAEQYHPDRGRVSAWLVGIARNRAIDILRGRQHQERLRERQATLDAERLAATDQLSTDETEMLILRQVVGEALAGLSLQQRQVVELAYYGGLTQVEIARRLGEPLGTVKTRTRAALDRLRVALRPFFDADSPGAETK